MNKEEVALLGQEFYDHTIRHQVEPGQNGRIVAVDVQRRDYEFSDSILEAIELARACHADAILFAVRVGHPAIDKHRRLGKFLSVRASELRRNRALPRNLAGTRS